MLIQLRFKPAEPPSEDAFQLLMECHERIREFSLVGLRLARQAEVPPHERSEAARGLVRYFTEAFPLHVDDEDASLAPRLLQAGLSPEAVEALLEMSRQHADIEALLAVLIAVWKELAEAPERHPPLEPELTRNSERLAAQLEAHLYHEERTLFPEARKVLPPEEARALLAEMRARRAPKTAPPREGEAP
ncbi:hemerythrin domain-containing protein [Pyxidicoccus fallax]|uniref:Hemerythrin domain-containing protein n=1 Tax=Pyxidicoccus fallax TaxID=394095 RepID=A0A848LMJ5_9BACT|nr:hemerythrin domain-containing protein [Pyxidicoccus fallax]NMO19055.1 hemerythrin domain-containing protein [Pyxidicoccus fallax]NPC82114.1 hemerythrin domain-containing protein [Pyxidicoccus fallax]